VFTATRGVVDGLNRRDVTPALQWCGSNRAALKRRHSHLEFHCRVQAFIELLRRRLIGDAIAYAQRFLSASDYAESPLLLATMQEAMTCLAYVQFLPPDADVTAAATDAAAAASVSATSCVSAPTTPAKAAGKSKQSGAAASAGTGAVSSSKRGAKKQKLTKGSSSSSSSSSSGSGSGGGSSSSSSSSGGGGGGGGDGWRAAGWARYARFFVKGQWRVIAEQFEKDFIHLNGLQRHVSIAFDAAAL
jgi:hypothetical protein